MANADGMNISRRGFLIGSTAIGFCLALTPGLARASGRRLEALPVLDARASLSFQLQAIAGEAEFFAGARSPTMGFNQSYLGPVIRVTRGTAVQAGVTNTTDQTISVHWHGLLAAGDVDGGPHNPIGPGESWEPLLPIDQPAATLWYHTHIHGKTGAGVYAGLAGVLIIDDEYDEVRGLPRELGVDDLVFVIQDKRLAGSGLAEYAPTVADELHGFLGDTIVINGVADPIQAVPPGIVRLRLLNGSNARNYALSFADGRRFHLTGTDQGLLPNPLEVDSVRLTPGERIELLVDFSIGASPLISEPHDEGSSMGGMGHSMGGPEQVDPFTAAFQLLAFEIDNTLTASVDTIPASLAGAAAPDSGSPVQTRQIVLNDMGTMPGAAGMMMNHGGIAPSADPALVPDGSSVQFSINGQPYDHDRVDLVAELGSEERWIVSGQMMGHPFHVHGVRFRVLSENGGPIRVENNGWKDTVFVDGEVELLVEFRRPATDAKPFMFHCHVLEHEDRGMMGQLAVKEAVARFFTFELVGRPVRTGALVSFSVALIDTVDGSRVTDASIRVRDFNMEPEGMAGSNPVTLLPIIEPGVQPMEARPDMSGRWALILEASIPGRDPFTETLIVRIPD